MISAATLASLPSVNRHMLQSLYYKLSRERRPHLKTPCEAEDKLPRVAEAIIEILASYLRIDLV